MKANLSDDVDIVGEDHEGPAVEETLPPEVAKVLFPDVDDEKAALEEASLSDDARRARWQSRRPRIGHLADGVASAQVADFPEPILLPLFDVGDRIVVDVCTNLLRGDPPPWLHTIVGKVRSIDDDTGLVTIYDEDSDPRLPKVRYASFRDLLHTFKVAPVKGDPFDATKIRKVKPPLKPGEVRRGRGRPAGTKNRPKEVIEAEREARKTEKKR